MRHSQRSCALTCLIVSCIFQQYAYSAPITVNIGDTLGVNFRFSDPFSATPEILWSLFYPSSGGYNGEHTATLYNGTSILGVASAGSSGAVWSIFDSTDSPYFGGHVQVDFSSIRDRSINGRIETTLTSGPSLIYDPELAGNTEVAAYRYVDIEINSESSSASHERVGDAHIESITLNGNSIWSASTGSGDVPPTAPGASALVPLDAAVAFDPSKPIAVVTHGWQPGRTYLDSSGNLKPSPLKDLQDKLGTIDGIPSGNLFAFNWEGAYEALPSSSLANTANAGTELSNALLAQLPTGYNEQIHFIGHSHGSVVNAEAIYQLKGKYDIAQATLLDTPRDILSGALGGNVTAGFLYNRMPAGSVTYVENFYSGNPAAFGNYLPYAGPGSLITDQLMPLTADHTEVWTEYQQKVGTGSWVSPLEGNAEFDARTGPNRVWNPIAVLGSLADIPAVIAEGAFRIALGTGEVIHSVARDIGAKGAEVIIGARDSVTKLLGIVIDKVVYVANALGEVVIDGITYVLDNLDGGTQTTLTPYLNLIESSPSAVEQLITIPIGADYLVFDMFSLAPGDGDWLTVHFNDDLLFTYLTSNLSDDVIDALIPVDSYAGRSGVLTLRLNSVGESNAQIAMGRMAFVGDSSDTNNVPEPGTLALLALGVTLMALSVWHQSMRSRHADQ